MKIDAKKLVGILGLCAGLINCSTTSRIKTKENSGMLSHGRSVVQQPGAKKNVISKLSRAQWIQVKRENSSAKVKLYANLGARAFDVAIYESRVFLKKNPKDYDALVVLATGLAMTGKYQLSGYYADLIEKYYPGRALTKNLKGLAHLHKPRSRFKDYKIAVSFFSEAVSRSDDEVAAGLNLGHLYLEMGHASAALNVFRRAQNRCDDCIISLMGEGTALIRMGKFREARLVFESVLEKNANHLEARYRLALVALNGEKNPDKAAKYFRQILDHPGDQRQDLKRRANVLLRRIEAKNYVRDYE